MKLSMDDPDPKEPPPDADPEKFPPSTPPEPTREPDEPGPDVIGPPLDPLAA